MLGPRGGGPAGERSHRSAGPRTGGCVGVGHVFALLGVCGSCPSVVTVLSQYCCGCVCVGVCGCVGVWMGVCVWVCVWVCVGVGVCGCVWVCVCVGVCVSVCVWVWVWRGGWVAPW